MKVAERSKILSTRNTRRVMFTGSASVSQTSREWGSRRTSMSSLSADFIWASYAAFLSTVRKLLTGGNRRCASLRQRGCVKQKAAIVSSVWRIASQSSIAAE